MSDDLDTYMSRVSTGLLAAYLILLNVVFLALLFLLWPSAKQLWPFLYLNDDIRLLLISVVAGAIGSTVINLLSLVEFIGVRRLKSSWGWWYVVGPLMGMTVGLFVYIAIRGGILKTGSNVSVDVLNPYSVATIAALGGAFSREILAKLQERASTMFKTHAERGYKIERVEREKSKDSDTV